MSVHSVQMIVRRAISDLDFRAALVNDPQTALADYDLTDEERANLSKLDSSVFDSSVGDLEGRLSRGWMN